MSSSLRSEKNVKGAGQNNLFPWSALNLLTTC
jgi:hypothetical protein